MQSFKACVQGTTFLGNCVRVHARLPDGSGCTAELTEEQGAFAAGEAVHLWWHAADEMRPGLLP